MVRRGTNRFRPQPSLDILATVPFSVEDIIGPDVYLTRAPDVKEIQLTPYSIQITYEDLSNVSAASVNRDGPVIVKGPNDFEQVAVFVATSAPIDAPRITVEYQVFDQVQESLNGIYTIEIDTAFVQDVNGAPPELNGPIGSFAIAIAVADDISPTAEITRNIEAITLQNNNTQAITIKYRDNVEVDANTISADNLAAVTPDGENLQVSVENTTIISLVEIDVTYRISPPTDGWQFETNGTYNFGLGRLPVMDTSGNPVDQLIGSFSVAVPDVVIAFSTTARRVNMSAWLSMAKDALFSVDWGDSTTSDFEWNQGGTTVVNRWNRSGEVTVGTGTGIAIRHDYDESGSLLPAHSVRILSLNPSDLLQFRFRRKLITSIAAWSNRLINLNLLDLRDNQLSSLPPFHREWRSIDNISLNNNQLNAIPPTHKEWTLITQLFATGNPITEALLTHKEWTLLESYGIANTSVINPPVLYAEQINISRLFLEAADLIGLPDFFPSFTRLNLIAAASNRIQRVNFLPEMIGLREVYLNLNQISEQVTLFDTMVSLEKVNVSDNQIPGPFDTYATWVTLSELKLSGNLFNQPIQLHEEWPLIVLHYEDIGSSVHPDLKSWPNLKELRLSDNLWIGSFFVPDTYTKLEDFTFSSPGVTSISLRDQWSQIRNIRLNVGDLRSPYQLPSSWINAVNINFSGTGAYPLPTPPGIPNTYVALEQLLFSNAFLTNPPSIPAELVQIQLIRLSNTQIDDINPLLRQLASNGNPANLPNRVLDIVGIPALNSIDATDRLAAETQGGWRLTTNG